jgi:flagellin-like protein
MNVKELFTDDEAVSPVIGVILMVAITVILAAVIGAFVLNIGGSQDTAPSASLEIDSVTDGTNDYVVISHEGGAELTASTLKVTIGGDKAYEDGSMKNSFSQASGSTLWSGDISAGDTLNISDTSDDTIIDDGDEVTVVWSSPSSDKTSILASGEFST